MLESHGSAVKTPACKHPLQNADYWKQVFADAEAEAKRLETRNTLTVAAAVALVLGLIFGVFLLILA